MTLSIPTFRVMNSAYKSLSATISKNFIHQQTKLSITTVTYAECYIIFIVILNFALPSIIVMITVTMLSVVVLSVVMLSVVMLSVVVTMGEVGADSKPRCRNKSNERNRY